MRRTCLPLIVSIILTCAVLFSGAAADPGENSGSGQFSNGLQHMFTPEHLSRIETAHFIAMHLSPAKIAEQINSKILNTSSEEGELTAIEAIYIAYYFLQTEWRLTDLEMAQLLPDIDYEKRDADSGKWAVYFNPALLNAEPEVFFGVEIDAVNGALIRTWDISEVEG